jgi:16S rRNA (guanine966-N2)-methyltransferase
MAMFSRRSAYSLPLIRTRKENVHARVIAGQAGSVPLFSPDGRLTRPTSDKAKGALFSILSGRMPVSGFLDLYAGSGQIGLEAASRGCQDIVLVEKAAAAVAVISKICRRPADGNVQCDPEQLRKRLRRLVREERQFSIIFMDPRIRSRAVKSRRWLRCHPAAAAGRSAHR